MLQDQLLKRLHVFIRQPESLCLRNKHWRLNESKVHFISYIVGYKSTICNSRLIDLSQIANYAPFPAPHFTSCQFFPHPTSTFNRTVNFIAPTISSRTIAASPRFFPREGGNYRKMVTR